MSSVLVALDRLWRLMQRRLALFAALAGAVLLHAGRLDPVNPLGPRWPALVALACLAAVLAWRVIAGWPEHASLMSTQLQRAELGLLLLVLVHGLVQLAGGPRSVAQPLVYVTVIFLVGFNARPTAAFLTLAALALQLLLAGALVGRGAVAWPELLWRGGSLLGFALASALFLQLEVLVRRREHERRLAEEVRAMRDEARDFRLVRASLSSGQVQDRAQEEAKLARGALDSIHHSMYFVLDSLKRSLDLQTCVLLWLDAGGRQLRIKEMISDSNLVQETPIPAQVGALGGVVKNRLLLNLRSPRLGARGVPYYEGAERVGAFAGVPVLENGHLRGVLCADRRDERPFTPQDEQLLLQATEQVLRAIQTERALAAVERSKYEHERFHRASTLLNAALTLEQVYSTAFAAAREVALFDLAAITLYDPERRRHTICRVEETTPSAGGEPGAEAPARAAGRNARLQGVEFGENTGLVAMAVKNKHFLPAGGELREGEMPVFTRKLDLRGVRSLIVMPLIVKDQAVGTFTLAAKAPQLYPKHTREMLGVITNQVAVAIENAKMYARMEELATTDGLTALPNHRTFQARFAEMLARAERHGKPVSLVLSDVDKFKGINDTYGHPVGDQVLRRVAATLAAHARKVDLVARYGGEEFAIVLEETGSSGAHLLCERVRQAIAAEVLSSDKGNFGVTISLGVATYPEDGVRKEQLIERADQALYQAKHGGRNRTVCYGELRRPSPVALPSAAADRSSAGPRAPAEALLALARPR
ncbi:MAG: sensor domain-containing diguanylate cyclase [Proteobacteria bacterium]|nr:sensor domain-containing diguanylate cyclase [Pseudomonadota bacterium]